MRFFKRQYRGKIPAEAKYPCLVLVPNAWNDYGYRTLFKLWLYTEEKRIQIGDLKIADMQLPEAKDGEVITEIEETFLKLPKHQVSLGQSIDYYDNLKEYFPINHLTVLAKLNDLTVKPELFAALERLEVFRKSLIRSSEAEKIAKSAQKKRHSFVESDTPFDFSYSIRLPGADKDHLVEFSFSEGDNDEFRTVVLIGKNGTGKTQYLGNFANSLCDAGAPGKFLPARPLFTTVIAISFSLFDRFKIPRSSKQFSYKYIGFRQGDKILANDLRNRRLLLAFNTIKRRNRVEEWFNVIGYVIEMHYLDSILGSHRALRPASAALKNFNLIITKRSELLSSGQSILIFIVTELLANIQDDSIVLYDEPETHLHPNAIAKLVKALNDILARYNSFAIIATHSPIVVQETPSRNVRLFDRIGNTPIVKPLPIEAFGENLSKITDTIFYLNQVKEGYKEYFDQQIKNKTIDEINVQFDNKLSMNALLYLNAISGKKSKRKK